VPTPIPYGPSPEQLGDLWLPETPDGPAPVAAIWHGGSRWVHVTVAASVAAPVSDGATTALLHYLLDVTEPEQVKIGSRVEVIVKPKRLRHGSILDIEGFRPVKK